MHHRKEVREVVLTQSERPRFDVPFLKECDLGELREFIHTFSLEEGLLEYVSKASRPMFKAWLGE